MPNHIHGIIFLTETEVIGMVDATRVPARPPLPEIVRAFKTFSARRINADRGMAGSPVWQRGYYEHVIRSARSLERLRTYVGDNPARWEADQLHPDAANSW